MAKSSKDDLDMALALGGKSAPVSSAGEMGAEDGGDDESAEQGEPTAAFTSAFKEFDEATDPDARAQAFWNAVKACTDSY